jgi:hypothetical protein
MVGPMILFVVVVLYSGVALLFAALLLPAVFRPQKIDAESIMIGLLSCLLVVLSVWIASL